MQKKLLACLLVAPVAGTAMADINVEAFPPTAQPSLSTLPGDNGNGVKAVEGSKGNYTFQVEGGNAAVEVTVTMSAENASMGFGCTSATLEIVLDAETCASISTALEKALGEIVPTALNH